MSSAR
jgi:hypothetical protein